MIPISTRALFTVIALGIYSSTALSANNVWFIVDSSGSMAGKVDGTPKLDIAKEKLTSLIGKISTNTKVAMLTYGRNRKNDCKDIEIISPPSGKKNHAYIFKSLQNLKPVGKTPIADTLLMAGTLAGVLGKDTNTLVLISDGIETCGGDPCAVAGQLAARKISIKTHVVGFDISAKDRKQLECIAEKGKGKYFAANSTEGFVEAVENAVKLAQATTAPPPPPAPKFKEIFRDDFDGEELGENWAIVNPNPDAFIVEDGKLLLVTGKAGYLRDPKKVDVENFLSLDFKLPKGDWRMTAKINTNYQTFTEWARIGVLDKPAKFVSADVFTYNTGSTGIFLKLQTFKQNGKNVKHFSQNLPSQKKLYSNSFSKFANRPILLRLEKSGRTYEAKLRFDAEKKWVSAGVVTILRAKGKPFIAFSQQDHVSGETENFVDWIKIEVPE